VSEDAKATEWRDVPEDSRVLMEKIWEQLLGQPIDTVINVLLNLAINAVETKDLDALKQWTCELIDLHKTERAETPKE
jgi:hypothetical protein